MLPGSKFGSIRGPCCPNSPGFVGAAAAPVSPLAAADACPNSPSPNGPGFVGVVGVGGVNSIGVGASSGNSSGNWALKASLSVGDGTCSAGDLEAFQSPVSTSIHSLASPGLIASPMTYSAACATVRPLGLVMFSQVVYSAMALSILSGSPAMM